MSIIDLWQPWIACALALTAAFLAWDERQVVKLALAYAGMHFMFWLVFPGADEWVRRMGQDWAVVWFAIAGLGELALCALLAGIGGPAARYAIGFGAVIIALCFGMVFEYPHTWAIERHVLTPIRHPATVALECAQIFAFLWYGRTGQLIIASAKARLARLKETRPWMQRARPI